MNFGLCALLCVWWGDIYNKGYLVHNALGKFWDIWFEFVGSLNGVASKTHKNNIVEKLKASLLEKLHNGSMSLTMKMGAMSKTTKPKMSTSTTIKYRVHRIPKVSHQR